LRKIWCIASQPAQLSLAIHL